METTERNEFYVQIINKKQRTVRVPLSIQPTEEHMPNATRRGVVVIIPYVGHVGDIESEQYEVLDAADMVNVVSQAMYTRKELNDSPWMVVLRFQYAIETIADIKQAITFLAQSEETAMCQTIELTSDWNDVDEDLLPEFCSDVNELRATFPDYHISIVGEETGVKMINGLLAKETCTLHVRVYVDAFYDSVIEVPSNLDLKHAIQYAVGHIEDIPQTPQTPLVCVPNSEMVHEEDFYNESAFYFEP